MKIEIPKEREDRFCNECLRGQEEVEVITVGSNCIALCKDCRERLRKMMNEDYKFNKWSNGSIYSVCGVGAELLNSNESSSALAAKMQLNTFQKKMENKLK